MLPSSSVVFAPTDGVVSLCRHGSARDARGIDWTGADGLTPYVTCPFKRGRLNANDYALQGSEGEGVTMKVTIRTPFGRPEVSTTDVALVDGSAYDITAVDASAKGCTSYVYLTRLVGDGTCDLVARTTTYDEDGLAKPSETSTTVHVKQAKATDDDGTPALDVTVRTCDWAGERVLVRNGTRYRVSKASTDAEWTTLTCVMEVK